MEFDPNRYYVQFDVLTPGDEDLSKIVVVSKELFDQLEPYAFELGCGDNLSECRGARDTAWKEADADLRPSEIAKIPTYQLIYITVC